MSYIEDAEGVWAALAAVWKPKVFPSREKQGAMEEVGILTMPECERIAAKLRRYRVTAGDLNGTLWDLREKQDCDPNYQAIKRAVVTRAIEVAGDRQEEQRSHHPRHLHPFWCQDRQRVLTPAEVADDLDALARDLRAKHGDDFGGVRVCERRAARIRRLGRPPTAEENQRDLKGIG